MPPVESRRDDAYGGADDIAIGSAKALLRRAVELRRDLRSVEQRRSDDGGRFEVLCRRLNGRRPTTVAAYLSRGSEPGTLQLIAWFAAQDVRVLLPVLTTPAERGRRGDPAWAPYAGPDALRVGLHSILEPTTPAQPSEALGTAELIICPALAANAAGERLGRGGGWYDKALGLAAKDVDIWVLLNDDEVLAAIPTQSWDRRVTGIATPTRFIECLAAAPP